MAGVKTLIKKVGEVDTFRETAYSDKKFSKTRFVFVCLLFWSAIALFTGLIIYKVITRGDVSQNINAVKPPGEKKALIPYKSYRKILDNPNLSDSLDCKSTKKVTWDSFIDTDEEHPIFLEDDATSTASCTTWAAEQNATGDHASHAQYLDWCLAGMIATQNALITGQISAGDLIDDEIDLEYELFDHVWDSIASAYMIKVFNIPNYTDASETIFDDLDSSINNGSDFAIQPTFNISAELYGVYFNDAEVITCSYSEPQGPFDVFSFAFTTTTSFYGFMIIFYAFAYTMTKKMQHRGRPKEETEPTPTELEVKAPEEKTVTV